VDVDAVPEPYLNGVLSLYQRNISQEIHLGSAANSPFRWLVGAYYLDSNAGFQPVSLTGSAVGNITVDIYGLINTKSNSAFGQATYEIVKDTNLTAGLRYTHDMQTFTASTQSSVGTLAPQASESQTFNEPTWRLALDHKFSSDILGYVSYDRGIKSRGYSPLSAVNSSASYKPEQIDTYQAGLKTELLDRRLRLNSSAFWYNYTDLQVQIVQGPTTFTENAASARIKGLDFEAVPTDKLSISGGLAYTELARVFQTGR
jgi:iron complex outermembrane recepter protein